jgi:hypothetical protein
VFFVTICPEFCDTCLLTVTSTIRTVLQARDTWKITSKPPAVTLHMSELCITWDLGLQGCNTVYYLTCRLYSSVILLWGTQPCCDLSVWRCNYTQGFLKCHEQCLEHRQYLTTYSKIQYYNFYMTVKQKHIHYLYWINRHVINLMCSMSVHYIIQKTLITNKCTKGFFHQL